MKKILLTLMVFALVKANIIAQYPDLPGGGGPFNPQTLPAGSLVIAMDNQNQGSGTGVFTAVVKDRKFDYTAGNPVLVAETNTTGILPGMQVTGHNSIPVGAVVTAVTATTVTINPAPTATRAGEKLDFGSVTYSAEDFNLRAYGAIVTLLNNNVKLRWVIKTGKAKDAADFAATAMRVTPSMGAPATYNFAGGPFVVFQQDAAGVVALVNAFNALTATPDDDVKVYQTMGAVNVDIRYSYFQPTNGIVWKPKAAILDEGGNGGIHEGYLQNAGVPAVNYELVSDADFRNGCYTFASEPHNTSVLAPIIQDVRNFVQDGGNFLAQCAAARSYEMATTGRFQTTNGFGSENGNPNTVNYSNTDMSYFQINGYFGIADNGGSLQSWQIPQAPGNPPINNFYYHTSGDDNGVQYTNASVSKLRPSSQPGGMVFYLGSHSYDGNDDHDINGQRMYLNAFLTPTNIQGTLASNAFFNCGISPNPITVFPSSTDGPSLAYPLTFKLFEDIGPTGYDAGDPQRGNTVTMTAPNTFQGANTISAPGAVGPKSYLVEIKPAAGCLQARYLAFPCGTLPTNMNFTAVRNSSLVNLKWTMFTEQNSKGFNVDRMLGNGNWETIAFVDSRATGGNSSSSLSYTYTDNNNFKGISQYRIINVENNGHGKMSDVRAVYGDGQKDNRITVYPNPSDGLVNVVFEGGSNVIRDVSLTDLSGRTIKQWNRIMTNTLQINNLAPGMYNIRVVNHETGEQTVEKIVITKR